MVGYQKGAGLNASAARTLVGATPMPSRYLIANSRSSALLIAKPTGLACALRAMANFFVPLDPSADVFGGRRLLPRGLRGEEFIGLNRHAGTEERGWRWSPARRRYWVFAV